MMCPICNANIKNPILHGYLDRDFNHLKNNPFTNLNIVICKNCNFGFVTKYLLDEKLDEFYKKAHIKKIPFFMDVPLLRVGKNELSNMLVKECSIYFMRCK